MQTYLIWLILGLLLVAAELLTGTFYLLFLGLAALAAALAAFLGAGFLGQALVASACAVAGVLWVQRRRRNADESPMPSLDLGQTVSFESWVSEADRIARVQYRGALWEARVMGACAGQPGELLYIREVEGNTLHVSKQLPA
jgi:membrane protein implicated in regulation of membrane protease activity